MASSDSVIREVLHAYKQKMPRELKVIDAFLAYVLVMGMVQLVYMAAVGSFPYNSFLGGFLCTVGVFVLTVSLRMQLNDKNRLDERNRWGALSKRRAYVDWLLCNLILHMAVLNFVG
ncbi:unnamed protein product [Agarophyton chilense]